MNKAYEYAKQSIRSKDVPKYVKKQCRIFIKIADGKDEKYFLDEKKVMQIENVLKILVMPKGLKAGRSLYECTCGYQWLFYVSVLGIVHRENPNKRKYPKPSNIGLHNTPSSKPFIAVMSHQYGLKKINCPELNIFLQLFAFAKTLAGNDSGTLINRHHFIPKTHDLNS